MTPANPAPDLAGFQFEFSAPPPPHQPHYQYETPQSDAQPVEHPYKWPALFSMRPSDAADASRTVSAEGPFYHQNYLRGHTSLPTNSPIADGTITVPARASVADSFTPRVPLQQRPAPYQDLNIFRDQRQVSQLQVQAPYPGSPAAQAQSFDRNVAAIEWNQRFIEQHRQHQIFIEQQEQHQLESARLFGNTQTGHFEHTSQPPPAPMQPHPLTTAYESEDTRMRDSLAGAPEPTMRHEQLQPPTVQATSSSTFGGDMQVDDLPPPLQLTMQQPTEQASSVVGTIPAPEEGSIQNTSRRPSRAPSESFIAESAKTKRRSATKKYGSSSSAQSVSQTARRKGHNQHTPKDQLSQSANAISARDQRAAAVDAHSTSGPAAKRAKKVERTAMPTTTAPRKPSPMKPLSQHPSAVASRIHREAKKQQQQEAIALQQKVAAAVRSGVGLPSANANASKRVRAERSEPARASKRLRASSDGLHTLPNYAEQASDDSNMEQEDDAGLREFVADQEHEELVGDSSEKEEDEESADLVENDYAGRAADVAARNNPLGLSDKAYKTAMARIAEVSRPGEDLDWTKITDREKRAKVQNVISSRKYLAKTRANRDAAADGESMDIEQAETSRDLASPTKVDAPGRRASRYSLRAANAGERKDEQGAKETGGGSMQDDEDTNDTITTGKPSSPVKASASAVTGATEPVLPPNVRGHDYAASWADIQNYSLPHEDLNWLHVHDKKKRQSMQSVISKRKAIDTAGGDWKAQARARDGAVRDAMTGSRVKPNHVSRILKFSSLGGDLDWTQKTDQAERRRMQDRLALLERQDEIMQLLQDPQELRKAQETIEEFTLEGEDLDWTALDPMADLTEIEKLQGMIARRQEKARRGVDWKRKAEAWSSFIHPHTKKPLLQQSIDDIERLVVEGHDVDWRQDSDEAVRKVKQKLIQHLKRKERQLSKNTSERKAQSLVEHSEALHGQRRAPLTPAATSSSRSADSLEPTPSNGEESAAHDDDVHDKGEEVKEQEQADAESLLVPPHGIGNFPILDFALDEVSDKDFVDSLKAVLTGKRGNNSFYGRQCRRVLQLLDVANPPDSGEALFPVTHQKAAENLQPNRYFDGPMIVQNAQPLELQTINQFLDEVYDDSVKVHVQDPGMVCNKNAPHVKEVTMHTIKGRFRSKKKPANPWNCLELAAHVEDGTRPAFLNNPDCRLLTMLKLPSDGETASRRGYLDGWKEIEKWVLMAQAGALTEPHQDSHGYSTYITVNQGIIGFGWLSKPTDEERKGWAANHDTFTGGRWRYVVLREGMTVYFPAGTVHFVFRHPTASDTLCLGGHVLRCSQIVRWVKTLRQEQESPYITNEDLTQSAPGYLGRVERFVKQALKSCEERQMMKWGGKEAIDEFLQLKAQFLKRQGEIATANKKGRR